MATSNDNGQKRRPLPKDWEWTTLRQVSKEIYRYPTFYGMEHLTDGVPVIRGEHIMANGTISHDWNDFWFVSLEISNKFPKTVVETGDLIMSVRGSVGKIGIADELLRAAQVSPNCIRISTRRDRCLPRYLFHYLKSSAAQTSIGDNVNATTIETIKASLLSATPIPLAPIAEQERIVSRIEELFSDLDAGVAALERVRAGLKRYKGSVLKAAVEGILLEGKGGTAKGQLPEGWRWATLGELTKHLTSGSRGWAKYYSDEGSLFLRVGNFNRLSKTIDLANITFVNAPEGAETNRTRVEPGDLLITITADVGMVGVADDKVLRWGSAHINQHVGLVRLTETESVDFVAYALASEIGQRQFRAKQYGATKLGLNFEDIRSLEIPLPSLREQSKIVAEIERRLSVVRQVETAVEAGLARAARLRQAVLKSAFEGRLG